MTDKILVVLLVIFAFAIGHAEGHREGYRQGIDAAIDGFDCMADRRYGRFQPPHTKARCAALGVDQ